MAARRRQRGPIAPVAVVVHLTLVLVAAPAIAGTMSIGWEPVDEPTTVGYRIFVGTEPAGYSATHDVGAVTETTLAGITDCCDHFVAVKALAADGSVSAEFSNEVSGWPTPTITAVEPAALPAGATLELVLHGTNFKPGATVAFDDPAIVVLGSSVIDCRTALVQVRVEPGAAVGATSGVEIVNPDQVFGVAFGAVTVAPAPVDDEPPVEDDPPVDLASGLVAHWTMDAATVEDGVLQDVGGGGHHGQILGATLAEGRFGEALRFSRGLDQRVIVGDADALDLTGAFTVSAWIRAESYGEGHHGAIVSKFNPSRVEGWSLELTNESARASQRVFGFTGQSVVYGQPETAALHRWQHVALTYTDRTLTFWVDGAPSRTTTVMHDAQPGLRQLTIGNDRRRSSDFHGRIDELRVYARALDAAGIAALAGEQAVEVCADADGDGHAAAACGGDDCDDAAAAVHPGADETCGDWIDQDCDGADVACPCPDADADGATDAACGGTDCDDGAAAVRPGAPDACGDGVDQDCDGADPECPVEEPPPIEDDPPLEDAPPVEEDDPPAEEPPPAPLPPLVARWTMDADSIEGEVLRDVSGNGHHGTIIGATTVPGVAGDALAFDAGDDAYVVVPDADALDLSGGPFTVEAWIHAEGFGEGQAGAIVSKFNPGRVEGWELSLRNAGHQGLRVFGLTYQSDVRSVPGAVALRRWQHVAAIFAEGRVTFWVDGEWAGDADAAHAPNAGLRNLYIGNDKRRAADFDGSIDELAIWDGALPDDAIRALADGMPPAAD